MLRALLFLIVTVVMIGLLRTVVGLIANLFMNATVGPQARNTAARKESRKPEALQRDPICGTFVAPSASVSKERNGQKFYFCSAACRDKFV